MDVDGILELAGGPVALAKRLGVARTTVLSWRADGKIPGARIAELSALTGISPAILATLTYPPRVMSKKPAPTSGAGEANTNEGYHIVSSNT